MSTVSESGDSSAEFTLRLSGDADSASIPRIFPRGRTGRGQGFGVFIAWGHRRTRKTLPVQDRRCFSYLREPAAEYHGLQGQSGKQRRLPIAHMYVNSAGHSPAEDGRGTRSNIDFAPTTLSSSCLPLAFDGC